MSPRPKNSRLSFSEVVDKTFWAVLIGIGTVAIGRMDDLSKNIAELNKSVSSMSAKGEAFDRRLDSNERRTEQVETRINQLETKLMEMVRGIEARLK